MLFRSLNTEVSKVFNTYNVDGQTIHEVIYARAVSNYDYESDINDSRRQIKVIKSSYYDQIMREFRTMIGNVPAYIRTVS